MDLSGKPSNLFKSFNFFWAASLLILLAWIDAAKATESYDMTAFSLGFGSSIQANGRLATDLNMYYTDQDILDILQKDDPNGLIFLQIQDDSEIPAASLALLD